jgi:tetratricopeptide (TPR) repeat protein
MQNLSVAYRHLERYEESAKLTEEMFDVSRRTLGPDDPRTLDRAISLVQIYRDQQRWGDAEKLVRQVLEARLRTVGPDHPNSLSTIRALGLVFCDQGRFQEAVALYREAVGRLQTKSKIADSRELSRLLNGLASLLASCPDPAVRNATDAVALAAQLVEAAPKDENNWNTLGVAQYYDGQWSAAIESITKSIELEPPGDAWDWLILAMAHWRLGHLDDARSWFARSIDWMATKKAHSRELLQFHAEASELLGVADSSPAASGASESNPGTEPEAEGPSITK